MLILLGVGDGTHGLRPDRRFAERTDRRPRLDCRRTSDRSGTPSSSSTIAQFVMPDWGTLDRDAPGGHLRPDRPRSDHQDVPEADPGARAYGAGEAIRRGRRRRVSTCPALVLAGLRGDRRVPAVPRPRVRRALLIAGPIALVLTLLYWLREALRVYDHDVGRDCPTLPVVVHEARHRASTCPARRSGRSSPRSACS